MAGDRFTLRRDLRSPDASESARWHKRAANGSSFVSHFTSEITLVEVNFDTPTRPLVIGVDQLINEVLEVAA